MLLIEGVAEMEIQNLWPLWKFCVTFFDMRLRGLLGRFTDFVGLNWGGYRLLDFDKRIYQYPELFSLVILAASFYLPQSHVTNSWLRKKLRIHKKSLRTIPSKELSHITPGEVGKIIYSKLWVPSPTSYGWNENPWGLFFCQVNGPFCWSFSRQRGVELELP